MQPKGPLLILPFLLCVWAGFGQVQPPANKADSLVVPQLAGPDTLPAFDRSPAGSPFDTIAYSRPDVKYSSDSLDAPVSYNATDSIFSDLAREQVHLYGNAVVEYQDVRLQAAYILLDMRANTALAEGRPDSLGQMAGLPEFTNGQEEFIAERMRYNFKTEKGIVYEVTTQYNDIIVHGNRSKFVTNERVDTAAPPDRVLFNQGAIFTTCTAPEPHFGIRSRKQKVIPNDVVVVGASNLEIMEVPTPVWLPFGFFPLKQGRRTGLLFPRDYEYSRQWGFGLRDIGWYFPINDNLNLALRTNIYLKGTWGISATSQYRKRYKYAGNIRLGYDSRRIENERDGSISRSNSWALSLSHRQESAAHPSINFGGSVNIQANQYQSTVYNDADRVLQNQLNSNFSFRKNWENMDLSASFNHSQNTATRNVTINFPNIQLQTRSIYPFRRKNRSGGEKWYETFVFRYRGEARTRFQATDTTLFTQQTLEDADLGVQHNLTGGTSFKVFRFFNLNPSFTYREVWYPNTIRKEFDPTPVVDTTRIFNSDSTQVQLVFDTLQFGTVDEFELNAFRAFREYSAGISLNTQIFGTLLFPNSKTIRGLRHVIKPSISFNFAPDYTDPDLGYYRFVQTDLRRPDDLMRYSIFEEGIFGSPPAAGNQMSLNYALNNIFEAKLFSRKDSTERNVKLFDNIIITGNYNFAADSLQWSPVFMSGTTRLFKRISTFSFRAQFDPYTTDDSGRRIDVTTLKAEGKLIRFVNASANLNTRITVAKLRALVQGQEEQVVEDMNAFRRQQRQGRRPADEDFLSIFENFNISHNMLFSWDSQPNGPTRFDVTTNSMTLRGQIPLTGNWSVDIQNLGYDFERNDITYPSVGFRRDLHCWEMGLFWQPTRGTYSFYLRVKPGTLDFINIPYQRNNADAIRAFQ